MLPEGVGFRRALFGWNILGALDLLVAVGTAGWLNVVRPGSMIELSLLPLTLVPLWIVPVLLSTHLVMLPGAFDRVNRQLRQVRARAASG